MELSPEQVRLQELAIKTAIGALPPEELKEVYEHYEYLKSYIRGKPMALVAFALLGAELATDSLDWG